MRVEVADAWEQVMNRGHRGGSLSSDRLYAREPFAGCEVNAEEQTLGGSYLSPYSSWRGGRSGTGIGDGAERCAWRFVMGGDGWRRWCGRWA